MCFILVVFLNFGILKNVGISSSEKLNPKDKRQGEWTVLAFTSTVRPTRKGPWKPLSLPPFRNSYSYVPVLCYVLWTILWRNNYPCVQGDF